MALPLSPLHERKRVKVYELRENDWFDRGTGFCAAQHIHDEGRIFVESEDEPERTLLDVRIKTDDVFQKQQETLIVWTDAEGIDMALSFQETDGCGIVWNMVGDVQSKLPEGPENTLPSTVILPRPELGNLPEIESLIRAASSSQAGRDSVSKLILSEDYIANLIPLVEVAEDLEDLPDLHRLCTIMKTLILFNESQIIEYVVRDDIIIGVVGALEYDPDFPTHKANHRQYLADATKFREVVRWEDPEIRRKIHFTYRLQYLKDVVLARILDDPTFTVLNSLIFFHQVDIVQHIQGNTQMLKEIFSIITNPDGDPQRRKDAVAFIQQSCAIAKNLQATARASLYQNLVACGLFSAITFALQHPDASVRVAGTDILVAIIDHDALMMRNYIFQSINDKTKPMTDTLIELFLVETDLGVKAQIADAIKVLLDPNANGPIVDRNPSMENVFFTKLRPNSANSAQTDNFLETFYGDSAKKLFQPLQDLDKRESMSNLSIHEVSLFSHLAEILCFFIRQHSYRGKLFILQEGLACRIARLMECPEKHLKLTALKYFRNLIGLQDEYHNRQIMQHHLFEPILNIIYETMPRDNLLNSACLELFEFIKRENVKALILHLVENYGERLREITYVDTFKNILLKHEQFTDPNVPDPSQQDNGLDSSFMTSDADTPNTRHVMINGGGTRWQGLKDVDAEEDAYFNTSDGEDDDEDELSRTPPLRRSPPLRRRPPIQNGASPTPKPLVDYGDDDEDLSPQPKRSKDDQSSSPSTTPSRSPATPSSTTPSSTPPPPALAEKRRREEDEDEDELGKLSTVTKRRNSSTSDTSWDFIRKDELDADAGVEWHKVEKEKQHTPKHSTLRRKRSFEPKGGGGGSTRKISITLSGAAAKLRKDE